MAGQMCPVGWGSPTPDLERLHGLQTVQLPNDRIQMTRLELRWKWLDSSSSTHFTELSTQQDMELELSVQLNINQKWLTDKQVILTPICTFV